MVPRGTVQTLLMKLCSREAFFERRQFCGAVWTGVQGDCRLMVDAEIDIQSIPLSECIGDAMAPGADGMNLGTQFEDAILAAIMADGFFPDDFNFN